MAEIPTYELNDGTLLPRVGFGTYPLKGDSGVEAMVQAIGNGYRLLDSAVNYRNEREVGEALRTSSVPRKEVRVATKIPGRHHAYDSALKSLQDSAATMEIDTIDVALIHWPNPSQGLYTQAWRALVQAQRDGLVKTIGVSNFTAEHLRTIIEDSGVTPAINQIELHPYFPQEEMREVHDQLGIQTQAWSPLGKASAPFQEEPVANAAEAHDVDPGQVILRWHVQLGSLPLPKSATPSRQAANLDVFGFELTDEEMSAISSLGRPDGRLFDAHPDHHEEM